MFDSESGQVIPFASITFHGTNIGVMSNVKGEYSISTPKKVSRIAISSLGYQTQFIPIQKGVPQSINILVDKKIYINFKGFFLMFM